jgi:hypothetical protein
VMPAVGGGPVKADRILPIAAMMTFWYAIQLGETHLRELCARRKEQELLVLLPGAPSGPAVNRWLMRIVLLRHATAVASALVFVAALMLCFRQALAPALKMAAAPFALSVLSAPALLRDYARLRPPWVMQFTLCAGGPSRPVLFADRGATSRPPSPHSHRRGSWPQPHHRWAPLCTPRRCASRVSRGTTGKMTGPAEHELIAISRACSSPPSARRARSPLSSL